MSETNSHVSEDVKTCLKVFPILAILILITVAVHLSHLPYKIQIVIELIKAAIAIAYFIHLIARRQEINKVWWLTISVVIGLLFLPLLNNKNHITGTVDTSRDIQLQALATPPAAPEHEEKHDVH